ncbi:MAG: WG repeat-containing protein [Ekhidna sp.]|uniref:WG repeat-containing protein n=1 Tax=Ekhidna sp. TaxID=2608089 RepID=UPI0032EDDB79
MRNFLSIVLFVNFFAVFAGDFTVFEKDGYFGIKDQTGNVTVPAVYERLGWSNGSSQVYSGVIGFRKDNLWGLITVRNKALTGQRFYSIEPLSSGHFKASIKGKFSNHLFYGILDDKGKTTISFNYFSIEPFGANWLVSAFSNNRQQYGVVSFENELIVPTNYKTIRESNDIFICEQRGQKLDLFDRKGTTLQLGLDSLRYADGWVAYRDGYAGQLSKLGNIIHDFSYKEFVTIASSLSPIRFPEWTIYRSDSIFMKWECDSLDVSKNGMLIAYLNGAHHFIINNTSLNKNHELILRGVSGNQLIVQNSKTRKWSVLETDGKQLTDEYDTIYAVGDHYGAHKAEGWHLLDRNGHVTNRFAFQELGPGINGQFIAKRNDHWGLLALDGSDFTTFKYDSMVAINGVYLVSYLNRWGAMNTGGEWVVRSEFNEMISLRDLLIGRRGRGYTIFNNGRETYKTTARPVAEMGTHLVVQDENGKFGLLNEYGEMFIAPEYDTIQRWSDHFMLSRDGRVSLVSPTGVRILREEEGYQQVAGYGEDYFLVQKEGRWGFVDNKGRLRISNRYERVRAFNEGMAPVLIRGKWGFIDKSEALRIQPYYDEVEPFSDGASIVRLGNRMGLIDVNGKEVLELIWKSVYRLNSGNYIVQDMEDRVGLVDGDGSFILRPAYDHLEDCGDRVIVSSNGTWGILDYSGQQIFKINHEEIRVIGEFIMIKN